MAEGTDEKPRNRYSAPALSKGLDIIELLAQQTVGLKKSEIAAALGRSISEIFRMLAVLEERGYVMLDPASERYSLTMRLFELAHRHPPTRRLTRVAGEVMEDFAQETNQSVHLAILHGAHILVIAQTDPPGNNITSVRLGARVPIVLTASGAVLASQLDPARRAALLERLPEATPETIAKFEDNLRQFARQGYCESPSLVIAGIQNISVPIHSHEGEIIAALTVPHVTRLIPGDDPDLATCRERLIAAGHLISRRLGAGAALTDAGAPPAG